MFSEYMCRMWWIPSPGDSGQLTAADAYLAPPLWMAWVHRMRDSQPWNVLVDPDWYPMVETPVVPELWALHDTSVQVLVPLPMPVNTTSMTDVVPTMSPVTAQVTQATLDDSLTMASGLTRTMPS